MNITSLNRNLIFLKLIPSVGDGTILKILEREREFLDTSNKLTIDFLRKYLNLNQINNYILIKRTINSKLNKVINDCNKNQILVINILDLEYPESLRRTHNPPVILFYKGNIKYDYFKSISIIGTRSFSSYGKLQCEIFAKALAEHNFNIISGLALGIDSLSHNYSVDKTKCIGVIGNGLNFIYPKSNFNLYNKILDNNGCIISQFIPDEPAKAENFPLRNRIIAGLSKSTLVIEAAEKSGSLITAKMAFDFNRDVYSIPADINRHKSRGCNYLIKENIAKLVITPEEIINEYFPNQNNKIIKKNIISNKLYISILDILNFEPLSADEISHKANKNINEINTLLSEMELESLILKDEFEKWYRI